jgi:4-amino-4-deoxychorismate lyase
LIDAAQPALSLQDRGWQYGDGIFETMLLLNGKVRFWKDHLERLQLSCARLGMQQPDAALLGDELTLLRSDREQAVIKLTLMRNGSDRGYRPPLAEHTTRLWQLFEPPPAAAASITVRWCDTRLSRNAQLAGLKHCNRLEQVLAQAEWRDASIAEGLMLDTEGELVSGTMSNVFLLLEDTLVTPDLRFSGIAGVMRKNVLQLAASLHIEAELRSLHADDVHHAQEVFICNSVRGIQSVTRLAQHTWPIGAITQRLQRALQDC